MAAISQGQAGRAYGQGTDMDQWGHTKNSISQDSRQNFSYPKSYGTSPVPQSPTFSEGPDSQNHVLPSEEAASSFNFGDTLHEDRSSSQAANRFDGTRARNNGEAGRTNGYGGVGGVQAQTRNLQSGVGAGKDKAAGPKHNANIEDDKWIHRDKLTAIEIQEHLALGKEVPPELLRKMEEGKQRASSRTHKPARSGDYEAADGSSKRQRLITPSPEYGSYESDDDEPFVPEDPRSPDEIAADAQLDGPHLYEQRLRSSSSRIPISTNSPLPVPQEHLDRNTRLARKRGTSLDFGSESIVYPKSRSRSHSVTSQVLLDDDNTRSTPSSPIKAKAPAKGAPTGRKASTNLRAISTAKSRATSSARGSPAGRPTTRDGRPSTAVNRPEGDPPWLAGMYKPDPRLPPDQQILPTHAKRMMQEQWEKEGKAGQVYDRDFRPVVLHPDAPLRSDSLAPDLKPNEIVSSPSLRPSQQGTPEPQKPQLSPQVSRVSQREHQSPTRLNHANGEAHGGYSTIPKVQSTPVIGGASPRPENTERFDIEEQVNNEKGSKSKGCGCCVVM